MAEIIDFKNRKNRYTVKPASMPKEYSYRAEQLKCLTCGHETVSTVENNGKCHGYECPECGCNSMVFKDITTYGNLVYTCTCGSSYFSLHPTHGLYCVKCGTFHK